MMKKKLLGRAAAALAFLAAAVVGETVVLHNHDQVVNDTKLDAVTNSTLGAYVPPAKHVFVINIENKGYGATWGDGIDGAGNAGDPYLAHDLRLKGTLLSSYYATAHNSQPNYVAQISGQGPNGQMQLDCQTFSNVTSTSTDADGQLIGSGCVFPAKTPNLASQLQATGHTWKGYMDDMATPCLHPAIGAKDDTQKATATSEYAVRHNPFMYFHDIIDDAVSCQAHVVPLTQLDTDLKAYGSTPEFSMITPDLCNDGHDAPCANGQPGGLVSVDAWMKVWVPKILASPAFQRDGVLIITADESDSPTTDATACCGEKSANVGQPGLLGPGGGLIGALVISRWSQAGAFSSTPYNHYSLLASVQDIFRLPKTGYAADVNLDHFGLDVYNTGWENAPVKATTTSIPAFAADAPFSYQLRASGGTGGYTYAYLPNSHTPQGISVDGSGRLTANVPMNNVTTSTTASDGQPWSFRYQVTDSAGHSAIGTVKLTLNPGAIYFRCIGDTSPQAGNCAKHDISTASGNGTVGSAYPTTVLRTGRGWSAPPLGDWFSLVSGTLPPGMWLTKLDAWDGKQYVLFGGRPTKAGQYTFHVSVKDQHGGSAMTYYTVLIR